MNGFNEILNEFEDDILEFGSAVSDFDSSYDSWATAHIRARRDYTNAKTSADKLINFALEEYKSGKITKNEYDECIRGIDKLYSLNEKKKKIDCYDSYGIAYEKWRDIYITTIREQMYALDDIADDLVSAQYEIRNMATQTKIMYDRRKNLETIKWRIYYFRSDTSTFLSRLEGIVGRY